MQTFMTRSKIYLIISLTLIVILFLGYCREQRHTRRILSENQRLWNENRDLRKSLEEYNHVSRQIDDRRDVQQRVAGQFIERRAYYRRNWQQFITVAASDYRTGLLGGIRNLSVIVRNQTEYPLDNVVVMVQYMRNNNEVFKTEEYTIQHIAEKGTGTVNASNSRKGSKVNIKLLGITSQAMNFCWSAGKVAPPGNPDPYECVPSPRNNQ
ncbi:hypothetical protein [Chitinophaga solisilvae]|uniref:hypothetical protein n=1 Tax=Chitinophaga solisilvae TaxID=1233460 RepID=UPI00136ED5DC|nr:hypothetical protein [Chitinophaga solisilvae]